MSPNLSSWNFASSRPAAGFLGETVVYWPSPAFTGARYHALLKLLILTECPLRSSRKQIYLHVALWSNGGCGVRLAQSASPAEIVQHATATPRRSKSKAGLQTWSEPRFDAAHHMIRDES